jgi:hypothetical protein
MGDKPTITGLYQVRSMESEGEWEYVAVTGLSGNLMVHDPHIGIFDLESYHAGLTDIEWRHVA